MRKHGPWTINSSKSVYSDPWMEVIRDEVTRPDGKPGSYSTVKIKSGVCVLALDENDVLHLTKEFHYAVGRVTIEGVSGGTEDGESVLTTGKRELAEEIGLEAEKWTRLGCVDPFTAAINSPCEIYLAEQLSSCQKNPEGTEVIECVQIPFDGVLHMVHSGDITHAPTVVGVLQLALRRQR